MKKRRPEAKPASKPSRSPAAKKVNRILVGVRLEERLVKVLKGVTELKDCTLGELIEELALSAMEGSAVFGDRSQRVTPEMRRAIESLKRVYGVDYNLAQLRQK